jgi:hypothetical protein
VCIACWIPGCVELEANYLSSRLILTSTASLNPHLFKHYSIKLKGNQQETQIAKQRKMNVFTYSNIKKDRFDLLLFKWLTI